MIKGIDSKGTLCKSMFLHLNSILHIKFLKMILGMFLQGFGKPHHLLCFVDLSSKVPPTLSRKRFLVKLQLLTTFQTSTLVSLYQLPPLIKLNFITTFLLVSLYLISPQILL